jgi:hypothetical protein
MDVRVGEARRGEAGMAAVRGSETQQRTASSRPRSSASQRSATPQHPLATPIHVPLALTSRWRVERTVPMTKREKEKKRKNKRKSD